ncbi:MAG TPA: 2-oxo-4-hydroxy-4-carboxy-5-ureidoimidazoline decarboxylase [Vicinamibacterales bacterium]|nr:2-oxo-4-hydroxy-4-carboxy-5-ureidoimidazoline decarboxylase [Vicinamibacterales bacterium]
MTLGALNHLDGSLARAEFLRCCGSTRWATAMAHGRPFDSLESMRARGDAVWRALTKADWLEAFAAHPKIGEQRPVGAWSASEQAGMRSADDALRARLERLNAEYEARFGYIFIVCATGKTPLEMLSLLDARMVHDADEELQIAAEEQRKITALRLVKLVDGNA